MLTANILSTCFKVTVLKPNIGIRVRSIYKTKPIFTSKTHFCTEILWSKTHFCNEIRFSNRNPIPQNRFLHRNPILASKSHPPKPIFASKSSAPFETLWNHDMMSGLNLRISMPRGILCPNESRTASVTGFDAARCAAPRYIPGPIAPVFRRTLLRFSSRNHEVAAIAARRKAW